MAREVHPGKDRQHEERAERVPENAEQATAGTWLFGGALPWSTSESVAVMRRRVQGLGAPRADSTQDRVIASGRCHRHHDHLATVTGELQRWLGDHEYESVAQLRGSMSHATTPDPAAFERANYQKVLHSWTAPSNRTPSAPSS